MVFVVYFHCSAGIFSVRLRGHTALNLFPFLCATKKDGRCKYLYKNPMKNSASVRVSNKMPYETPLEDFVARLLMLFWSFAARFTG